MDGFVQAIKQYPGQQQVDRSVKVKVPGKHFPQLQASEQAVMYWGTAVEFRERQKFPRHAKAWGGEHTRPGIRFICDSDAIDDPDNKGFCMDNVGALPSPAPQPCLERQARLPTRPPPRPRPQPPRKPEL